MPKSKNLKSENVKSKNVKSKSLKAKLSATSTVMTVLFISAVIIFNAVFSVLANSFLWYVDMTEDSVFTLSDETREVLSDVSAPVNIYFTREPDDLMSGSDSSGYMRYIYQTALQLEREFSNINVECVDVIKNPAFFEYYYNTAATSVKTTSVIIESGGEFRLMSADAFLMWNEDYSDIWGYNGEAKMAAAILQVTASEMPLVCFTTGHGERGADDTAAFRELCETAGYKVSDVDLSKEELSPDARILVIDDPVYDFSGIEGGEQNEIDKIDSFLDGEGCLMVFADSENSQNLKNLSELLSEWGVAFRSNESVVDTDNSLSVDGREVVAKYETEDTLGASLYTDISSLSSMPRTVLKDPMPLELLYETSDQLMGSKAASVVLYSNDSSKVFENGASKESGSFPLMTVSREQNIKDNDYFYTYVLTCGSPDIASDTYLNSNSYANRDILLNTIRLTGREKIIADIEPKLFDDTSLTVESSKANAVTALSVTLLPAVAALVGGVVCVRRRRT